MHKEEIERILNKNESIITYKADKECFTKFQSGYRQKYIPKIRNTKYERE